MIEPKISVGVLTLATDHYLKYWANLVESSLNSNALPRTAVWYIFTNLPTDARQIAQKLDIRTEIIEIDGLKFPEASLKRYKIYYEFLKSADDVEDFLIYVDADMLFVDKIDIAQLSAVPLPHLVLHPGYFREKRLRRLLNYVRQPKLIFVDLYLLFKYGGVGTWESRKYSTAFVPRKRRSKYFCGGIWFANRDVFIDICKKMSSMIEKDLNSNVLAIWHDESYLNSLAAVVNKVVLLPSYCFDPLYVNLSQHRPIVVAVDKNAIEHSI